MSRPAVHHLLQRLLVRLLHDPELAARVLADPDVVMAEPELAAATAAERAFVATELSRIDPRALGLDPLRRRRVLKALASEYRLSVPLCLWRRRRLDALEGFFASPEFHGAVMARGSLAPAFGDYLARLDAGGGPLAELARYERRLALCRRTPAASEAEAALADGPLDDAAPLALASGAAVERFTHDVLATAAAVETHLFEVNLLPFVLLCEDAPPLELPDTHLAEPLCLLIVPDPAQPRGASVTPLEPALAGLLEQVDGASRPLAALVSWLGGHGLGPRGARALLESLLAEGTLVRHYG
jgi:hypothetical protein